MEPRRNDDARAQALATRRRVYRRRRLVALAVAATLGLAVWGVVVLAGGGGEGTAALPQPAATGTAGTGSAPSAPARLVTDGPPVRTVALTFDDGSCADCIAAVLQTLAKQKVPATLFPNGSYAAQWEPRAARVKRLIAKGLLELGNHGWSHENPTELDDDALREDLASNEEWIEATFGVSPRPLFRPPFGAYDDDLLAVAGELGYTVVVTWTTSGLDWETDDPKEIVANAMSGLQPGAIVLLHVNSTATAKALPKLIEAIRAEGYGFAGLRDFLDVT